MKNFSNFLAPPEVDLPSVDGYSWQWRHNGTNAWKLGTTLNTTGVVVQWGRAVEDAVAILTFVMTNAGHYVYAYPEKTTRQTSHLVARAAEAYEGGTILLWLGPNKKTRFICTTATICYVTYPIALLRPVG